MKYDFMYTPPKRIKGFDFRMEIQAQGAQGYGGIKFLSLYRNLLFTPLFITYSPLPRRMVQELLVERLSLTVRIFESHKYEIPLNFNQVWHLQCTNVYITNT